MSRPDSLVLGGGAPVYIRESREPEYLREARAFHERIAPCCLPISNAVLLKLLGDAEHRKQALGLRAVRQHGADEQRGACPKRTPRWLLVKESGRRFPLKTDCNGRYVYLNPRRGAMIAVAESARNVVCTGATPVAITNCLNFGNPYKPEVYWQFKEAVRRHRRSLPGLQHTGHRRECELLQ